MTDKVKVYLTRIQANAYAQDLKYMEGDGKQKLATLLASSPGSGMGRPLDLPIHDLARRFYADIEQVRFKLNHAIIIDDLAKAHPDKETIDIGASVTFEAQLDGTETFLILGPDEADPQKGIVSHLSPIGKAMLGKRAEEHFKIRTGGPQYLIKKVEYLPLTIQPKVFNWKSELNRVSV